MANSHAVRQPSGHKTDQRAATWSAELLAPGLIKPRGVPPPEMRALRDLTRTRVSLVQRRTQAQNRVYKIVADTTITLASVVSEVCGKSARRLLEAWVAGERDAAKLSAMALGSWRRKIPQLAVALAGPCTAHHAKLIAGALELVDVRGRQSVAMDQQLHELLGPMAPHLEQLDSMPGVNEITVRDILAEMGLDMTRCGSASRLSAWAGWSPGHHESAGKRRQGRTRQGKRYLRRVLVQCAWATRKTSTFVGRTFRRLEARLGGKKAAVAVTHKIVSRTLKVRGGIISQANRYIGGFCSSQRIFPPQIIQVLLMVIISHLLLEGPFYEEERYERLVPRQEERERKRALKALERLGYAVILEKVA